MRDAITEVSDDEAVAAYRKGDDRVEPSEPANGKPSPQPEPELDVDDDDEDKRKQADVIVELARKSAKLFHTADRDKYSTYADIAIDEHIETHVIESRPFRLFLNKLYRDERHELPSKEAVSAAIEALVSVAYFDGEEREVHVRVAHHRGAIYLDLADPEWHVVRVTQAGWELVKNAPVRFRRSSGMKPLPVPERPTSSEGIEMLKGFLNVRDRESYYLIVGWLLAALRGYGSLPVLVINGEQGSAKSTLSAIVRSLVDPSTAPLRTAARKEHDLYISAKNSWVLAYDNLSTLPLWMSDALCRLATGGGFSTRQLYSDGDEVIFASKRPVILNGISEFVDKPDLADRSLFVHLTPIPEEARKLEDDIWRDFEEKRPVILGALLDAVVTGLQQLPHIELGRLPRMADFAKWVEACSGDFVPDEGGFVRAYENNRRGAVAGVIENDTVGAALREFAYELDKDWKGSSSELLKALEKNVDEKTIKGKDWPQSPRALTARIDRLSTFLRKLGIHVERLQRRNNKRPISVQKAERLEDSDG